MSELTNDVQGVIEALIIIRDQVLTDENITTAKGVITKMSGLLEGIYSWFINSSTSEEEVLDVAEEAGVGATTRSLLTPLFSETPNPLWADIEEAFEPTSRGISLQGVIDAIQFIQEHIQTSDDILADIIKIVESLKTIQVYSEKEDDSRSLDIDREGLRTLYDDLTQ